MTFNSLWAAFVAHGMASPDKMGESYVMRVFVNPILVVLCLVPAAMMGAGIVMTPDDVKGKKK